MFVSSAQASEINDGHAQMLVGVKSYLAAGELTVPVLPQVAVRVVGSGTSKRANAQTLADIVRTDASLTAYVLRIAASAAERPAQRIVSLQHALAWLGVDEVANIAFTLALQGRMLDVKGQQRKARRLWRHSLASALWSRQLAHIAARDTGVCYLGGLLHEIGKTVALGAIHDVAQRERILLGSLDYDRLVETFHQEIGVQVMNSWALPEPVPTVIARWRNYRSAGALQWECNVVSLAHLFADFTLREATMLKRDELIETPAYRDLGFTRADMQSLLDSANSIAGELDMYLSP